MSAATDQTRQLSVWAIWAIHYRRERFGNALYYGGIHPKVVAQVKAVDGISFSIRR